MVDSSKNAWISLGSTVALSQNCEEDVETKIGLSILEQIHPYISRVDATRNGFPAILHFRHDRPLVLALLGRHIE